ncbi:hypothetical protein IC582_009903 [Cucumis melo]
MNIKVSLTVKRGSRLSSCVTNPHNFLSCSGLFIHWPLMEIALGSNSFAFTLPDRILSSEDLPVPLGPTMAST